MYLLGSGRSQPSTFMYPHIARSMRASVRARFVSTELVKNVERIDRSVFKIGSSGLRV